MIKEIVLNKIKSIVGADNFTTSDEHRIVYSYDATPVLNQLPDAVVFPENAEQISAIMKLANEEKFAVIPRGAGTGLSGGSIPVENSIVLVMTKWRKIIELDIDNQTILVEPGVITETIDLEANKFNLFYPPDPGSIKVCTIGGNVAENAGGLRGLKYGVTKNYVLGIEFVSPTGELIWTGGKNFKDVAGYNLRDILVGSEGTLGIFTKILLRLIPRPKLSKTILAAFSTNVDSGKAVAEITSSGITPAMLEFLDNTTIKCVEDYAKIGLDTSINSLLIIEVDGKTSEVEDDQNKIKNICEKNNALYVKIAKDENEANKLKAARRSAFSALARVSPTTILEDATVPRSKLPEMLEAIQKIVKEEDVMLGNFGHAGDGNLHPTCLTDEGNSTELHKAEKTFERIFNTAIKLGGTITGEHGVGLAKKNFLELQIGSAGLEFMKKIKSVWDPNNVLNPGKIFSLKPKCEGVLPSNKNQIKNFEEGI
ncbi:MAG: FAD-binding protein [Ignavibacteria bacterium]|nr:FAD-binding protein [Ignavibacteria bacterium]